MFSISYVWAEIRRRKRRTGEEIIRRLRGLWQQEGLSVLLITHDPAVAGAAPRVVRLRDGRILEVVEALAS